MAVNKNNLISIEFTLAEVQQLKAAMDTIDGILNGKVLNLTPEERQQYGSVNETNKLFVNKVRDFMEQNPQHVPQFVDMAEFEKDYQAREVCEKNSIRLSSITEKLRDTKVALDFDNYHACLVVYKYLQFLASQNVPGMTTWEEELKQFFPRTTKKTDLTLDSTDNGTTV